MRAFGSICTATLLTFLTTSASADVAITACGGNVPAGETGVLQGDVVCSLSTQTGVVVESGGTLVLDGHSLSGGANGVLCTTSCTIQGPGEITGFSGAGISSSTNPKPRITVIDTDVLGNLTYGIVLTSDGKLSLLNVNVTANNHGGIAIAPSNLTDKGSIKGENVHVHENDGTGIKAKRIKLLASSVETNDGTGILSSGKAVLIDSDVIGNGTDFDPGYDLKTIKRPVLKNTVCNRSGRLTIGNTVEGTWAVCTDD
ncbi:MAG TPA: hypothetical protein VEL28_21375 [Candidatus Binatia bacterium]|nr:hypothetical protein [Candidatus Binatia bacterium]